VDGSTPRVSAHLYGECQGLCLILPLDTTAYTLRKRPEVCNLSVVKIREPRRNPLRRHKYVTCRSRGGDPARGSLSMQGDGWKVSRGGWGGGGSERVRDIMIKAQTYRVRSA